MAKKKPTRKRTRTFSAVTKRKRSAIDGRYGGEKAAEMLARRIIDAVFTDGGEVPVAYAVTLERIKAELLAATTVVEKVQKRIGKVGWAVRRPRNVGGWLGGEDGMGWPATVFDTKGEAADLTQARDCSKCKVVRVKLVEVP